MEKRLFNSLIFILALAVLSSAVIAAHTATVTLIGGSSIYETTNSSLILRVDNAADGNPADSTITGVSLTSGGTNLTNILNTPYNSNGSYTTWSNLSISWWQTGNFFFAAIANQLNQNTTYDWTIYLTDAAGDSSSANVQFTVLNDANPPSINSIMPSDYSFVKNNTINFNINVQELETSLPGSFSLTYRDGNSMVTSGLTANSTQVNKGSGNVYSASWILDQNLKPFIDYRIEGLSDAAGNIYDEGLNLPHHLYIDKQYPSVVLNQPEDNLLTNQYLQNIFFNMSDNSFEANGQGLFNPQVNCTANVGSNSYGPQSYTNNVTNGVVLVNLTGLPDGNYLFNIQCTDKAGYVLTTVARTLFLDTTGPVITLNAPTNGSIILNGTQIALNITDSPAGVSSRWYNNGTDVIPFNSTIDTSNWNEGINNIDVYANDTLNNVNKIELNFTIDKTAPTVTLAEPFNNTVINSNGDFIFNATDNYDNILTCNLFMDGSNIYTIGGNSGQITTISDDLGLSEGYHSWYVSCMDDVTLVGVSETRNVSVDATAPQINNLTAYTILNDTNDNDGLISFSLNITDVNGISACEAYVNNSLVQTNATPDFSFNIITSNNPYTVQVGCNDTVDNWLVLPEIKIYYDNIAPVISGVLNSSITDTGVVITWDTDELSDSNVTLNGVITLDNNMVLNHNVSIIGLTQLTQYIYNVTSRDRWNNTSPVLNFYFNTTATPPPEPPPTSNSGPSPGGGPPSSRNKEVNETINTTTGNISKAPSTPVVPKEENKTVTEELEGPKFTGLTIMDNLKSSIPLAVIAGIITLIILGGLYRIANGSKRLNPSTHKHINMEYRQDEVKDDDIFED